MRRDPPDGKTAVVGRTANDGASGPQTASNVSLSESSGSDGEGFRRAKEIRMANTAAGADALVCLHCHKQKLSERVTGTMPHRLHNHVLATSSDAPATNQAQILSSSTAIFRLLSLSLSVYI